MPVTDIAQINIRKSTAAQWSVANTLLVAGEYGMETDTKLVKLGDGVTLWNALGYMPEQLAKQITSATSKATPVDADEIPLADSAATFGLKKLLLSNLKTYIFNAVTTAGDILYATAAGVVARLGIGTTGQVLTVVGGLPSWAAASASAFVGARTTISVAQSIPNATQTVILFDTEQYDTNTIHSTASNTGRMTVPTGKGGYWGFKANVTFNGSNLTGRRILVLLKNGATVKLLESAVNQATGAPTSILMLDTLLLIAGDYVEIAAYQSSGGALNLDSDAQNTGATSFVAEFMGA